MNCVLMEPEEPQETPSPPEEPEESEETVTTMTQVGEPLLVLALIGALTMVQPPAPPPVPVAVSTPLLAKTKQL